MRLANSNKMKRNKKKPRRRNVHQHQSQLTIDLPPDPSKMSRKEIISQFHKLTKQLAVIDKSPHFPNEACREQRRQALRAQIKILGIERYQKASREGETLGGGFDCSQWVMEMLQNEVEFAKNTEGSVKMLDVGAITHRFPDRIEIAGNEKIELDVTSIDLNPEDSEAGRRVIRADFFEFAKVDLRKGGGIYNMICLSLCVNFVGCPRQRGLMLVLAARLLATNGLLFIVLPKACVENSRYLNEERLGKIVESIGLEVTSINYSEKLIKVICKNRAAGYDVKDWQPLAKKEVLRGGEDRNNFAISLDTGTLQSYERVLKTTPAVDDVNKLNEESEDDSNGQEEAKAVAEFDDGRPHNKKRKYKTKRRIDKAQNTSNRRKKARRNRQRRLKQASETAE